MCRRALRPDRAAIKTSSSTRQLMVKGRKENTDGRRVRGERKRIDTYERLGCCDCAAQVARRDAASAFMYGRLLITFLSRIEFFFFRTFTV